jgi:hypothetical protein
VGPTGSRCSEDLRRRGGPHQRVDRTAGEPSGAGYANVAAYLLPDSTDRNTCVVLLAAQYWYRTLLSRRIQPQTGTSPRGCKTSLGPCAFYAAFGRPGVRSAAGWVGAGSIWRWSVVDQ